MSLPGVWLALTMAGGCSDAAAGAVHGDPIASVVLWLGLVLLGAKLGGDLVTRLGQPAVLGELAFGIVLGNLPLVGFRGAASLATEPTIDMLARLGVILLLFEVGLESTVAQMLAVGGSSLLVATIGVVTPSLLGYGVSCWLQPDASLYVHLFIGATLSATSVGITARVLKDLGRAHTEEARIVLGAAVLDDVMGLVVLAVVTGLIRAAGAGTQPSLVQIGATIAKALLFLFGSLFVGMRVTPHIFGWASRLRSRDVLLALGLTFCFVLSWLANSIELAPIVGAFAAGLILDAVHYRDFTDRGEQGLEELVRPLVGFLAPIFFVLMGMRTDLRAFAQPGAIGLAAALTVVAILGKQLCYFGVLRPGLDRLSVGIGMIPRGEVGLIFANLGATLTLHGAPVISATGYSAVVVMVLVTTLVTPPALKWSLHRRASSSSP